MFTVQLWRCGPRGSGRSQSGQRCSPVTESSRLGSHDQYGPMVRQSRLQGLELVRCRLWNRLAINAGWVNTYLLPCTHLDETTTNDQNMRLKLMAVYNYRCMCRTRFFRIVSRAHEGNWNLLNGLKHRFLNIKKMQVSCGSPPELWFEIGLNYAW